MANDTAVKRVAKKSTPARKAVKKSAAVKATPPASPPPGWYPDPAEPEVERYWDGEGWDASQGARRPGGQPVDVEGDGGVPAATAPAGTITFRNRVMPYKRPSADQLAVWKMVADRAQTLRRDMATNPNKPCPACKGRGTGQGGAACDDCAGTGSAHTGTTLKLFKRAMTIINSILTDEADRDWLEDELIAGHVDLLGASEIVNLAVADLVANQPAAAAPRTGPAPKARRRR